MQVILLILAILVALTILATDLALIQSHPLDIVDIKLKLDRINEYHKVDIISISKNNILFKCRGRFHKVTLDYKYIKLQVGTSMESLSKCMKVDYYRFNKYLTNL